MMTMLSHPFRFLVLDPLRWLRRYRQATPQNRSQDGRSLFSIEGYLHLRAARRNRRSDGKMKRPSAPYHGF